MKWKWNAHYVEYLRRVPEKGELVDASTWWWSALPKNALPFKSAHEARAARAKVIKQLIPYYRRDSRISSIKVVHRFTSIRARIVSAAAELSDVLYTIEKKDHRTREAKLAKTKFGVLVYAIAGMVSSWRATKKSPTKRSSPS